MIFSGSKGLFVVFEGIDGSGSSTQTRLLCNKLLEYDHLKRKILETSEPTKGPVGYLIRNIMKHRIVTCDNNKLDDRLLAHLFAADRHDHLYNSVNGVIKKIQQGYVVVSTRYFLSSLAYHADNMDDYSFVYDLNKDFPLPDITFYIDCPVDVSIQRLKDRGHLEKYENEEKLMVVHENYNKVIENYKGKLELLDGTDTIDNLHKKICSIIKSMKR